MSQWDVIHRRITLCILLHDYIAECSELKDVSMFSLRLYRTDKASVRSRNSGKNILIIIKIVKHFINSEMYIVDNQVRSCDHLQECLLL